jgi:formyltetrahydrofolate deformylase
VSARSATYLLVSGSDRRAIVAAIGRDIERTVVSRAVHWHLQDRVIVDENRTVVF